MKVGDIIMRKPTIDCKVGIVETGPRPCRVLWIHPEGRFYRVEFWSEVTGETWRECFYLGNRIGNPSASATLEPQGQSRAYKGGVSGGWLPSPGNALYSTGKY